MYTYPAMVPLFGISGGEILILLLLVLLLFGPSKIPEIARMLGKGIGEIRKMQGEIHAEINRYSSDVDRDTKAIQDDIDRLRLQLDSKEPTRKGTDAEVPLKEAGDAPSQKGQDKQEMSDDRKE